MVEKVDAQPLDGNSLDSIYFQQRSATPLPFTVENEVATVSFQGLPGEAYYLSALKDSGVDSLVDHVVGLLSVVPYEQLTPRIVLVPLSNSAANGLVASEIEQELQRIYAQAVVRPSVTLDAVFSPEGYTPPLRAVNSGLLSNYTPQMNDIIRAYEDQPGYDPNTYYLFLTDDYEATDRAGFMPRGRQFGFLYMGNTGTGEALARTLAHEIGHGAYVLEHSFDAHPDHLPQYQTDNLMDYANGTHLYKWQWDLIHDPVNAPFLEGDESGEMVAAAVGSNLPCVISAGKNILTPDLLGIQFTKSIACSFDNSLQVGMIEFQLKETDGSYSDIYKWRPQGGSAGGYRKSIDPSGDYSDPNATTNQPPAPVLNVPIYYGKMQSIDFQCYCFIYEITDQVEVTPTGSGADGITSQYTVELPLSYNNSVFKYRTPAHSTHCSDITPPVADLPSMLDGLLEEHIDAVTGKNTGGVEVAIDRNNLDAYIERVMAFYEANGYHGNVLLYNESTSNGSSTNRTLTEYKPGELPITYGSNSTIQTKLTAFENGAFTSTDFGILIDASGSGNARVTVNFKQGFLAPLSTVTNPLVLEVGLENISTVGEDVYRDDLKDFVLGKLHVNGQLESSIYQNEGFTPQVTGPYDGRFRVIESSGGMEWLGFAMAELGHVIKKAEVDASLWNPKEQNIYDNKLINMYAPIGGVIDQGLIEVKDLYDMYGLCKQFIDKPKETAGELYNHFANMSAGEIVYMLALEDIDQYRTNYNNAILGEEKQYAGIRASMYTTITAIKVVAGSSLLLVIRESGDIFELFDGIRLKANPDLDVKIRELSSAKKGRFQEDFKRDSPEEMQELLSHFDENPELVEAWDKVDELVETGDNDFNPLKKDPDFLKKFDEVANDIKLNDHLFKGEVKPVIDPNTGLQKVAADGTKLWNVSGAHDKSSLVPDKLRLKGSKTPPNPGPDDYYSAKVEAKVETFTGEPYLPNGGWKVKQAPSTFFPDSWGVEKIQAEIARVLSNSPNIIQTNPDGSKLLGGVMSDGVSLRIWQNADGSFISAFPRL